MWRPSSRDPRSEAPKPLFFNLQSSIFISSDFALRRILPAALALLCVVQLAGWVPHYLTWPWWTDHDVFAGAAIAWDAGIPPYEGYRLNNFPGTIYLFWILGKVFGWGRTAPLYAVDAAVLLSLGVLLVAWSRRTAGHALPGIAAYALFLSYYLELDYSLAAQRDWHGPFCLLAAILVLQLWPGRGGWIAAGLAAAIGLSIRPQTILLFPAVTLAVLQQVRTPGRALRDAAGPLAVLATAMIAGLTALALPLLADGLLDDFLASLATLAPGAGYSELSIGTLAQRTLRSLSSSKLLLVPMAIALLWAGARPELRRAAAVYGVAYLGALAYGPLSPIAHAYLMHAPTLFWSILCGVFVAMALDRERWSPTVALTLVLLVLGSGLVLRPRFFDLGRSSRALGILQGTAEARRRAPLGYTAASLNATSFTAPYEWADYYDTLAYLRDLPGTTRVGNALYGLPALVGPSGRVSLFPAESIAPMTVIGLDIEDEFVRAAGREVDGVVVWNPAEVESAYTPLPALFDTVRRHYVPERQFGTIEIWRRRGE
jgi:hypothetical protein